MRQLTERNLTSIFTDIHGRYAYFLKEANSLKQGKQIHGRVIVFGLQNEPTVQTNLIDMYAQCGRIDDARKAFEEIQKPSLLQWNLIIARYVGQNMFTEGIQMYRKMQKAGLRPDHYTFPSLLRAAAHEGDLQLGSYLHKCAGEELVKTSSFVANSILIMYSKCGRMEDACHVFVKMSEKDAVSWNVIIAGFSQNGRCDEAIKMFWQMQRNGLRPNTVTWNSIIAGCSQNSKAKEALEFFRQMLASGTPPDAVTVSSAMPACVQLRDLNPGRELHRYALVNCFCLTDAVENALIDMYAKCDSLEEARSLFERSFKRSVVRWNCMISSYSVLGFCNESLRLLQRMSLEGTRPNNITLASVIPAVGRLAQLQQGKQIHGFIFRSGYESFVVLGNALIDMYCRCGEVPTSRMVFDRVPEKDVVSWTAMIAGYGMQGNGKDALSLFSEFRRTSLKPDGVLFVALLSACSHSGLVLEGQQCFDIMQKQYGIVPVTEHYACIVDLLGRAGNLNEAEEFVNRMPIEPTPEIWCALLGACRIHCNVEVGERAADQLFRLRPRNPGFYILMSNIYSEAGLWENVAEVRKAMKEQGLRKNPGWSCIEIGKKIYEFRVDDRRHAQSEAIYATLEKLRKQIKELGYVPDTRFVLYDYG